MSQHLTKRLLPIPSDVICMHATYIPKNFLKDLDETVLWKSLTKYYEDGDIEKNLQA